MRDRWLILSSLWEENKGAANKLGLLERLDYYGNLSAQLEWQRNPGERPVRVVYTKSGEPTAALLRDDDTIVDHLLFWVICKNLREAHYLLAIINSDALAIGVNKYTTPNWAGNTRDLHKHLWKLSIPEFDLSQPLHIAVSEAGGAAAEGAARQLAQLRGARGHNVSVTIARRELRKWLRKSVEGQAVETNVKALLS